MKSGLLTILVSSLIGLTANADSSFELTGKIEGQGDECSIQMKDRNFDFESYTMTYSSKSQRFQEVYGMTMNSLSKLQETSYRVKANDGINYEIQPGGVDVLPIGKYYRFSYILKDNRFIVNRHLTLLAIGELNVETTEEVCILD